MKRSAFVLLTSIILLTSLWTTSRVWGYSGGDGTEGSPFEIATADDLISMNSDIGNYDKHFVLTADIDLTGWSSSTLSLIAAGYTPFSGQFDGAGHVVRNLRLTGVFGSSKLALFGLTSSEARIMNLGVVDVYVQGDDYFGALVAYNSGTITNCYSTGRVATHFGIVHNESQVIGGLVAKNDGGTIMDCHSSVTMVGHSMSHSGGLVGFNLNGGRIVSSYSTGSMTTLDNKVCSGDYVGGLVGLSKFSTIESCYSTSTISGYWHHVGGLVGQTWEDTITECHYSGSIETVDLGVVAGLAAYSEASTIESCYSTGTVSSTKGTVAGLVAQNAGGTITDCYSACDVIAGDVGAAGLVVENYSGTITSSSCAGSVTGEEHVAGLVAATFNGSITDCFSTCTVDGTENVNGLVALCDTSSITSSFWDAEASGIDTSNGGTPKTTAEMETLYTCLGSGWNFRVSGELEIDTPFYNIGSMTIREDGTFSSGCELHNESGSTLSNDGVLVSAGTLINQSGAHADEQRYIRERIDILQLWRLGE